MLMLHEQALVAPVMWTQAVVIVPGVFMLGSCRGYHNGLQE